jgi:tRNA threonylcarbamoyladenosine biosynthesis protein TsaB
MQSISARHSYTSLMARVVALDSTTAGGRSEGTREAGDSGDSGKLGDVGDVGDAGRRRGLVLALDAGSPVVSVAIGVGGEVLAERAVPMQRSSTQLLALVAEVLAAAGARPGDLAGVVALAGPGSFTGLRVGLATALGLVQGLGVPAQALPALAVLAAASGAPPGALVIAAVDALRGEWSAQAFRAGPVPEPLGEMTLVPAGELLRRLAPAATAAIIAFGVSALACGSDAACGRVRFREAPPLAPAALRLASAMPEASWRAASLASPIYSRPPAVTLPKPRS